VALSHAQGPSWIAHQLSTKKPLKISGLKRGGAEGVGIEHFAALLTLIQLLTH